MTINLKLPLPIIIPREAVGTVNMIVLEYRVKRTTKRWPFALCQNTVDISALNAFVLWTTTNINIQKEKNSEEFFC